MTKPHPPARATRREWTGLAVLALPCVLYSMDMTVLNLALPTLSAELRPSASELLWIVDIYGFLLAGFLVTMGTLGDRIGRRRLLLSGAVGFGFASVLAACATSTGTLIASRALLGIAGATIAPSTLSLIRHIFQDAGQRSVAIGVWVTSYSVGSVIGPLVGGVMLAHFGWGSVFLLGVPVMLLLLVLGPWLLPEFRNPSAGRPDLGSAVLSLAAVLAVIHGVKRWAEQGAGWPAFVSLTAGLAFGAAFVRRQRRAADPLMDFGLFRLPVFSASLAAYGLSCFAVLGVFLFVSQYFQVVLGCTPLQAGLWTLPWSAGFIVGALAAPAAARRIEPAWVMCGGLVAAALGFALLTLAGTQGGLPIVIGATVVSALGLSPVFTLANDLVVGTAPPERAGTASSISETGAELGGALGIALLGCVGAASYRGVMAAAPVPAGLSSGAWEAAWVGIGPALSIAKDLPAPQARAVTDTAREAFMHGLQAVGLISALLMGATALLFAWTVRRAQVTSGHAG